MGFARRIEAGGWLIGGEGGQLAVYATDGVREVVRAPRAQTSLSPMPAAVLDDSVGRRWSAVRQTTHALGDGRASLDEASHLEASAYVSSLQQLDDSRWVICGRLTQGTGFAAIYSPGLR